MVLPLLVCLVAWSIGVNGFEFINFNYNLPGNTTYTIRWDISGSEPDVFDLILVQPQGVYSMGLPVNSAWTDLWTHAYAIQIPRNGNHFLDVTLGPSVQPGAYYWRMSSANGTLPLSNTFLISSSVGVTNPTTITSLIPVTATQDVVQTSDGREVTYRSSQVYSSAVVYTTIIVVSDSGKGAPLTKVPMIAGIVLALLFLITLPIVLWLVLRYRRRPNHPSGRDKPTPIDLEDIRHSSVLNLTPSNASVANPTITPAVSTRSTTRQVWAIVNGEKRLITVSDNPPRPLTPPLDPDPFADPSTPKSPRRILVPTNPSASDHDLPSTSINSYDPLLSRANTTTTSFSAMHSHSAPSVRTHVDPSASREHLSEKMAHQTGQRLYEEPYALSEEDITSRIIVPGRAVDMGPLERDRVADMDENGLLPPDYFQATQPIPSRRSSQAGPSTRS
ncbi:unnamed protein product [Rhizoctonia solani]|uniref:Uncharacterized protein n=1 Tax=Rhizoctonia solani TaxID=456999 RepID=A0A8H3AVT8_9AGAM|nr:unnamed protein product [Rhizoctonia solani]